MDIIRDASDADLIKLDGQLHVLGPEKAQPDPASTRMLHRVRIFHCFSRPRGVDICAL